MWFHKHTYIPKTLVSVSSPLAGDAPADALVTAIVWRTAILVSKKLNSLYDDTADTAVTGVDGAISASHAWSIESVDCDKDDVVVGSGRLAVLSLTAVKPH